MTKHYTFNEAMKLPFGTKFRLPWWSKGEYIYLKRTDEGSVSIFTEQNRELEDGHVGTTNYYLLQDRFTVVDCKHDFNNPEPAGTFEYGDKNFACVQSPSNNCNICGEFRSNIGEESSSNQNHYQCKHYSLKKFNPSKDVIRFYRDHHIQERCKECNKMINLISLFNMNYVTRAEALENVATGKWDGAVYDCSTWIDKFQWIGISGPFSGWVGPKSGHLTDALSQKYAPDTRWYNPDEGEK